MIEYGIPIITRYPNRVITNYVEVAVDPETNCLNDRNRQGREMQFHTNGTLASFSLYQNNQPVGISYIFERSYQPKLTYLESVTSHENKYDIREIEFTFFKSGGIRDITYSSDHDELASDEYYNSKSGYLTERNFTDSDGTNVTVIYTRGVVSRVVRIDPKRNCGSETTYSITRNKPRLSITRHQKTDKSSKWKLDNTPASRSGFHLTRVVSKRNTFKLLFMNGEHDVTADIKAMVADFTNIQPEEEAMIQLAFGPQFCVILPEIVRNELATKTVI